MQIQIMLYFSTFLGVHFMLARGLREILGAFEVPYFVGWVPSGQQFGNHFAIHGTIFLYRILQEVTWGTILVPYSYTSQFNSTQNFNKKRCHNKAVCRTLVFLQWPQHTLMLQVVPLLVNRNATTYCELFTTNKVCLLCF